MFDARMMVRTGLAMVVAALVVMTTGCDDSDSGDPVGTSTVQGNISDFNAGTAVAMLAAGVKEGITVKLVKIVDGKRVETSYTTTTAGDGTFVISGVTEGEYILVMEYNGVTTEYPLGDIPDNSRVEVSNISVNSTGTVVATKVDRVDLGTSKKTTLVDDDDEETFDIAGKWKFEYDTLPGDVDPQIQMELTQDGEILNGTLDGSKLDGTLVGESINLKVTDLPTRKRFMPETITGNVNSDGTEMSGEWTGDGEEGTWTAVPGTVAD